MYAAILRLQRAYMACLAFRKNWLSSFVVFGAYVRHGLSVKFAGYILRSSPLYIFSNETINYC